MDKFKKVIASIIMMFAAVAASAQATTEEQGFMRSEGKIYVVVAIVLTILIGAILYLILLDRKISRLENNNK